MSTEYKSQYVDAVFLKESRQRFLCTVLLNGREIECYVSSSSKISKYLNLYKKSVLLSRNKGKNLKTLYTLEAVEIENQGYIFLNFNKSNRIFEKYLISSGIAAQQIQREKIIGDSLRVDFHIECQGCFEVKSLLSPTCRIDFPDTSSKRLYLQMLKYIELLNSGTKVTFVFIAMSCIIVDFRWNILKNDIKELFVKATELGMATQAYSVDFVKDEFELKENPALEKQIIQSYFN